MKTREWNPASLRFTATRMEDGGCQARSVLESGSPLPLSTRDKDSLAMQIARGLAQSKTWRQLVATFVFAALPLVSTFAQSYSIDWYKVSGGGGTSTGGTYQVSGTIGQHDAGGPMTGGNYSLTGGYWALTSVVQTPGLPNLTITFVGPDSVVVSWPNTGNYTLQQNYNLANTSGSTTSGYTVTPNNGTNSITISPPVGNLFFRLKNP